MEKNMDKIFLGQFSTLNKKLDMVNRKLDIACESRQVEIMDVLSDDETTKFRNKIKSEIKGFGKMCGVIYYNEEKHHAYILTPNNITLDTALAIKDAGYRLIRQATNGTEKEQ